MQATRTGTSIEQEMLREDVLTVGQVLTQSPGVSAPPLVVLETGRTCFHKRFSGQRVATCGHYGHHPYDVPLNEVAAWRLAFVLGAPYRRLAPTCVLRKIEGLGGALINDKKGKPDPSVFTPGEADGQVAAAGFWDALIGNQDRHMGNFRYDPATKTLGLIDHGFSFARPGDVCHASVFLSARHQRNKKPITPKERAVLEVLVESDDLLGLRGFIALDRADALEARARRMLQRGCLTGVGAF